MNVYHLNFSVTMNATRTKKGRPRCGLMTEKFPGRRASERPWGGVHCREKRFSWFGCERFSVHVCFYRASLL